MDTSLRSTACGRPFSATHKLTATPGGSQPFPLQTVIELTEQRANTRFTALGFAVPGRSFRLFMP